MLHLLHSPEGDWRDWNQIRAWATTLAPRLTYGKPVGTVSYGSPRSRRASIEMATDGWSVKSKTK
jgi:hypothetical protein